MLRFELSIRAARDLKTARIRYDEIDLDLGTRFLDEVEDEIRKAAEQPTRFPAFDGHVRAARCATFPYRIYFEVLKTKLRVLAIYHTARDSNRWNDPERK